MNENYNIRRATAGDAQILAYIQTESWKAAFQNILEPEDLEQSTNPERATAMYQKLLDAYHKWIAYSLNWKKERNASMKDLQFPFPYREGQRDIVSGVYHTVSSGKTLFVQAPTGVGKTMSAIFPSVRAIGEGKAVFSGYSGMYTGEMSLCKGAF